MIQISNLNKYYGSLQVLKNVELSIASQEIVTLLGASGAGKTTLLNIIGTLDKADSGIVEINGRNISELNEKQLSEFRNKEIGFVYQFHYLLNEFTALENIIMPALIAKEKKNIAIEKAKDLLNILNIYDRAEHKPSELSGGEQQRVAIARALINRPSIILADEPSGNLDTNNAKQLHELFFQLRETYKQTFLIVTHNNELAQMSDRRLIMQDGKII
ncbi:MAG: ABC transporter ATP-binding protein [Bacteroidales bacterium]|jgi:lipoprotein-releasing system ATP-binding protein|nr:ABC transporter ATP-binding protein [Bacteroidales bacterium]MBQ2395720.1 ABC transporter ATP-binding protein [Bacteroidales bacterium]MBQ5873707.1 ABC transporter ATP-binding protein [Bacteroidales bacterium]MBQ5892056.1 ABC transporter ATP-binding protein [Bacteroidales bacterium]MED9963055.1 ABC transporter ATP-binding protein [Bacteroidales bacterium]